MLNLSEIIKAVNGVCNYKGGNITVKRVCTDTRKITQCCLFIALKGENFDGHDYIADAAEKGADIIISEKQIDCPSPVIVVKDTGKALIDVAGYYRSKFAVKVVGVTGSVGKTSTKDIIACALSSSMKTLKTIGNLNNQIGLPLTLFRLDESYRAAVIEMGMSDLGEIKTLSETSRPDIGVITNVGFSHIETLKTRENILKAKLEITEGMRKGSPLIINGDDDLLAEVKNKDFEIITYGILNKDVNISAVNIISTENSEQFDIKYNLHGMSGIVNANIPIKGEHNIMNALASFAVCLCMRISPETAAKSFDGYHPSDMRQNIVEKDGQKLIIDCYNASPASMKASIDVLKSVKGGRRIAVLADMLELGDMSPVLHSKIAEFIQDGKIDLLLLYGEQMKYCKENADKLGIKSEHFSDKNELADYLQKNKRGGDILLFKASRGMKLEEVINNVWK